MSHAVKSIPASAFGQKVRLYKNLHNGQWSVQTKQRRISKKTGKAYTAWLLAGHAKAVILTDVTFEISEAGQRWTRQKEKRTVHAYVVGTLKALGATRGLPQDAERITYNPFKDAGFKSKSTGLAVVRAKVAYAQPDGGVHLSSDHTVYVPLAALAA